jgi:hypothetical protein
VLVTIIVAGVLGVLLGGRRAEVVAERRRLPNPGGGMAGHGVDVLMRIYAKCVVGQDELAKRARLRKEVHFRRSTD